MDPNALESEACEAIGLISGNYTSLIKIAETHVNDAQARISAGMNAVKILAEGEKYTLLRRLARRADMPLSARIEAGLQSVRLCAEKGPYKKIILMAEDQRLPEEVRKAAELALETAGMKAIESCIKENKYLNLLETDLNDISLDDRLPDNVRKAAASALDSERLRMVESYISKGWFHRLLEIGKNNCLSEEVRTRAGAGAIRECVKRGRYSQLIDVANNPDYPQEIRDVARNSIGPAGMRAVEICIKKGRRDDPLDINLKEMSLDERLPERIRNAASSALSSPVNSSANLLGALHKPGRKENVAPQPRKIRQPC